MVFGVMASLAEFERALIQERIHSGLRRAKLQGKRIGRPTVTVDPAKARQMRQEGHSLRQIASALSVGKGTVDRLLRLSQNPA
jgi:DNA invertase Pin-like site-specific DNA recombinase